MKKLLGCFLALVLLVPVSAFATPSLGVSPGHPGDDVFYNTFVVGGDGFLVPSTGSFEITIWYGEEGQTAATDVDIYLATTAADGLQFAFESSTQAEMPAGPPPMTATSSP